MFVEVDDISSSPIHVLVGSGIRRIEFLEDGQSLGDIVVFGIDLYVGL